ncbi:MAG: DNA replication and repair protein RecF [Muribaculaceae bacterium]|nr:DNA replication and repair protein RecF [Muribaculaceae bacterium]
MILRRLSLANFKNIAEVTLELSPKINCFLGDNGMGKSNLLDALYFLSYCKSFSGAQDGLLVKQGEDFSTLHGIYLRRGLDEDLTAGLRPGQRKVFRRGGKPYKRLAEHLGSFPLVLLSPSDMNLVQGEPSERRRFLDQIVSQSDARYLDALMRYNAALEQRNKLLRDEVTDDTLFDALEAQLEMAGEYITARRRDTVAALADIFTRYYRAIAANSETPALNYVSADYSEAGGLAAHMARMRARDRALHYTASGPHRDDINFTIDTLPVRRSASQGQTKTYTTALRFAQYELLRKSLGLKPLLLLDDIFDKLDAGRVHRIMDIVGTSETFGQIFITDTNRRHLDEIVADIPPTADNYRLWSVEHGVFSPIEA